MLGTFEQLASGNAPVEFPFTKQQDITAMRVKRINPFQQVRGFRRRIRFPERHRRKAKESDRRGILFSQLSAELLNPGGQHLIMDCRMSRIYVFERSWREHDRFLVENFHRRHWQPTAFLEVLDTSVANVALPYIAGDLGASYDDSTWVLTSYLAANAIVLPVSGWLAEVIGRKRYFMLSLIVFTVSSLLCGLAPNLPLLLIFRAIQGIGGGGLQPMAQAILNDTFPPEQRGSAFALYGITAVLAPTVGPMLGGWITDNYSWRWIFFIKLPIALLALYMTYTLVRETSPAGRVKNGGIRVDYIGIAFLTLGVASLQVVLDKGQEDDWFGSQFILALAITAAVCLSGLVIWKWCRKDPIIDVRMFKSFNFAAANLMMFMMGVMLFSTLVLIPEFLQTLLGYTAELAGLVLSASGFILLLMMPVVGRLTSKVQARFLIAAGWLCLAIGLIYSAYRIDLLISFNFAMWLRCAQVVGIGFLFVSITAAGYIGVPAEKGNSVSGMVNFMRNIGSSIGTSIVTTMIPDAHNITSKS